MAWITTYNHTRLHSTLGDLSPIQFEKKWLAGAPAKAAADFAVLAKDSPQTGNVPRQSDAAVAPLLDPVFNTNVVTSKPAVANSDPGALADWVQATAKVGAFYLLAGTGTSDIGQAAIAPAGSLGAAGLEVIVD